MTRTTKHSSKIELVVPGNNVVEAAGEQINYLLHHAGLNISTLVFSGHASSEGLTAKEHNQHGNEPPEEADDDAFEIFFADYKTLLGDDDTNNPLWYAQSAHLHTGSLARLDVYDATKIYELLPKTLYSRGSSAWLTEEQLDGVRVGTFVLHIQE